MPIRILQKWFGEEETCVISLRPIQAREGVLNASYGDEWDFTQEELTSWFGLWKRHRIKSWRHIDANRLEQLKAE